MKRETLRVIDANFNRSREGLRVCEDTARFVLNSPALTRDLKYVRHGVTAVMRKMPVEFKALIDARNVSADVGKASRKLTEMTRLGHMDIFMANIERAKEALRALEEFFKLIDKDSSARLSRLRFKTYEIEKKAVKRLASLRNSR